MDLAEVLGFTGANAVVVMVAGGILYWLLKRHITTQSQKGLEDHKVALQEGLEDSKARLKRVEVLFSRKLDTLVALNELLVETEHTVIDFACGYGEGLEDTGDLYSINADEIRPLVKGFLVRHQAFLPPQVREKMSKTLELCVEQREDAEHGWQIYNGIRTSLEALHKEVGEQTSLSKDS